MTEISQRGLEPGHAVSHGCLKREGVKVRHVSPLQVRRYAAPRKAQSSRPVHYCGTVSTSYSRKYSNRRAQSAHMHDRRQRLLAAEVVESKARASSLHPGGHRQPGRRVPRSARWYHPLSETGERKPGRGWRCRSSAPGGAGVRGRSYDDRELHQVFWCGCRRCPRDVGTRAGDDEAEGEGGTLWLI